MRGVRVYVTMSSSTRLQLFAVVACLAAATIAGAQQSDTSATARHRDSTIADTLGPRPEHRPPISPRRAFLYSLALPGYSQSILGRYKTGTLLAAFEATAILMRYQMSLDLREAQRFASDSFPVSFMDKSGNPLVTYQRT